MSCDVGKATEGLENDQSLFFCVFVFFFCLCVFIRGGSPGDLSKELVT